MKSYLLIISLAMLLVSLAACSSSTISVTLFDSNQKATRVKFLAKDYNNLDQTPYYSQVRVYDISSGCEVPACPLMWHAIVSDIGSPTEIQYGVMPGFGSITMLPPKQLEKNHQYRILLDQQASSPRKDLGSCDFSVEEDSSVSPLVE